MSIVDDITVRLGQLEDLEECSHIDDLDKETLKRHFTSKSVFVAATRDEIVGYLRLEYLWSKVPFIALIQVCPKHLRQGIGQAVLGFLESFLREKGHLQLLSSAQVDEPSGQNWHRAMGFEECGILAGVNEAGIGEVFFRKVLGDG